MSFILDALRKAERDKQRGSAPSLKDVIHTAPASVADQNSTRPWILGVVVLLLLLMMLMVFIKQSRVAREPATADKVRAAGDQLAVARIAAVQIPMSTASVPTVPDRFDSQADTETVHPPQGIPDDDAFAAGDAIEDIGSINASSFDDLLDKARPGQATAPTKTVVQVATKKTAAATEKKSEKAEPALVDKGLLAAATSTAEGDSPARNDNGVRPFNSMPDAFRSAFPQLRLDVHVYDAEPDRRWVMINGTKYVEGLTLSEGPIIDEISENGVIYRYRGELTLLPLMR